jgi:hypothetical protein
VSLQLLTCCGDGDKEEAKQIMTSQLSFPKDSDD